MLREDRKIFAIWRKQNYRPPERALQYTHVCQAENGVREADLCEAIRLASLGDVAKTALDRASGPGNEASERRWLSKRQ